jgi:hypothetical protein
VVRSDPCATVLRESDSILHVRYYFIVFTVFRFMVSVFVLSLNALQLFDSEGVVCLSFVAHRQLLPWFRAIMTFLYHGQPLDAKTYWYWPINSDLIIKAMIGKSLDGISYTWVISVFGVYHLSPVSLAFLGSMTLSTSLQFRPRALDLVGFCPHRAVAPQFYTYSTLGFTTRGQRPAGRSDATRVPGMVLLTVVLVRAY